MKKLILALIIFTGLFQCINLKAAKCEWCARCHQGNWEQEDADENGKCPEGYVCAKAVGQPPAPLAPCAWE